MRTDKQLDPTVTSDEAVWSKKYAEWAQSDEPWRKSVIGKHPAAASFSGGERDHLFLSSHAEQFTDLAGLSGLDLPYDGRGYALMDYDRDGWYDVSIVNSNAPWITLFRNEVGKTSSGRFLALRFRGGNQTNRPDPHLATRDGYGAVVTLELDGHTLMRELHCGEGFAAQNSDTLLIGLGEHDVVPNLTVRWPSGKTQSLKSVAAGSLVTAWEVPSQNAAGTPFSVESYRVTGGSVASRDASQVDTLAVAATLPATKKFRAFITMATWCEACQRQMPQVRQLTEAFDPADLEFFGLPIDLDDTPEMLRSYYQAKQPAYQLLVDTTAADRENAATAVRQALGSDALPSTIVTDAGGHVISVLAGVPSVSDLRRLIERQTPQGR